VSAVVTIDLGEDWAVAEDPPARPRRHPPAAVLAALLVLVVLLVIGGSAAPRPAFVLLADLPVQGVTATEVGGDSVFIAVESGGRRSVARYALDGGAPIWKASQPGPAAGLVYVAGADALMVWLIDYPGNEEQFTVLDAATGRRLWQSGGNVMIDRLPDSPHQLMRMTDPDGTPRISYVDMRDGRTIWTRTVPDMTQVLATDGQAAAFLVGYADGTVLLLARETGEVLATVRLDPLVPLGPGGVPEPENSALFNVVHDRLMVGQGTIDGATTVSAYDLPGMRLQWSVSGELPIYPDACGPYVCLSGDGSGAVALDVATGSIVWRASGFDGVQDLGGGRLLGFRAGGVQRAGVLDAGTGRPVGNLGDWTPLFGANSHLVTTPDVANFRYTWFGVMEPGRGVVLPLGRLDGLSTGGCQPHEDLLLCRTVDARLKVWRYHE